jgi:hypothetical protein
VIPTQPAVPVIPAYTPVPSYTPMPAYATPLDGAGQPPPWESDVSAPPSQPRGRSRGHTGVIVIAAMATVLLVGAGVVTGLFLIPKGGGGHNPPQAGGSATVAPTTGPAPTTVSPTTSAPSPTPASQNPPARPQMPDDALALTSAQAITELTTESNEDASVVDALRGTWVPQVDGKCVGIPVDIQPNWIPDGTIDTPSVTIQEILAFHLSLHSRFGALTVRQTQVGLASDTATSGPCANEIVWFSIVPKPFTSADQANSWCDQNVPPVHECSARYVARPGEQSRAVDR